MNNNVEHRKSFDNALELVEKDVLEMTEIAERSIGEAVDIMENFSEKTFDKVLNAEKQTNELNLDVEKTCLKIVALHQPVARDLRFVASMMKIADMFERICDLSAKIAKIARDNKDQPLIKPLEDTRTMIDNISEMMELVRDSIKTKEVEVLKNLSDLDDKVDEFFKDIRQELMDLMIEDPEIISEASDLLYVARYIERIGDIVCKIGSRMIYQVKGDRVRIK